MQYGSVHPDRCMCGDTVKLYFQMFPFIFGRQFEFTAVPTETTVIVSLREVGFRIDVPFNRPVVRKVYDAPGRIVVVRRGSPAYVSGFGVPVSGIVPFDNGVGNVSLMETPAFIQGQDFARCYFFLCTDAKSKNLCTKEVENF